jgi:hypothetical protein
VEQAFVSVIDWIFHRMLNDGDYDDRESQQQNND